MHAMIEDGIAKNLYVSPYSASAMSLDDKLALAFAGIMAASSFIPPAVHPQSTIVQNIESCIEQGYSIASEVLKNDFKSALPAFQRIADTHPNSAQAYFIAGNARYLMDPDWNSAVRMYDKAIKLDSSCAEAYCNRGTVKFFLTPVLPEHALQIPKGVRSSWEEAVADLEKAISNNPELFSAHFNKGVILTYLFREKEAIASFENAIRIGYGKKSLPLTAKNEGKKECLVSMFPVMFVSGITEYITDTKLTIKKRGVIVKVLGKLAWSPTENDPLAFAHYFKGIAYTRNNIKDYKKAVESHDKAIRLNPNVPVFYHFRGMSYLGLGDIEKALSDRDKGRAMISVFESILR